MSERYILGGPDGHTPVPCEDLHEWGKWFETADRHVTLTEVGELSVSTVFLGSDHAGLRSWPTGRRRWPCTY